MLIVTTASCLVLGSGLWLGLDTVSGAWLVAIHVGLFNTTLRCHYRSPMLSSLDSKSRFRLEGGLTANTFCP